MIDVKIIVMGNGKKPEYKTPGAAGADLYAAHATELAPGQRKHVATGVKLELPEGFEAQIRSRSGLAWNDGVIVFNQPSTIDSDYRGEIEVLLWNTSQRKIEIKQGERVAQMIIAPVARANFQDASELGATERGEKGWGSTGRTDAASAPSVGEEGFVIGEGELTLSEETAPLPRCEVTDDFARRAMMFVSGYSAMMANLVDPHEHGLLSFDREHGFGLLHPKVPNVYYPATVETMRMLYRDILPKTMGSMKFVKMVAKHGPDVFNTKRAAGHLMVHATGEAQDPEGECKVLQQLPGIMRRVWEEKIKDRPRFMGELMMLAGTVVAANDSIDIKIEDDRALLNGSEFHYTFESVMAFYKQLARSITFEPNSQEAKVFLPLRMTVTHELATMGAWE